MTFSKPSSDVQEKLGRAYKKIKISIENKDGKTGYFGEMFTEKQVFHKHFTEGELEDFIKENDIDIAVVAVPVGSANDLKDKLIDYGIRAIWNFSNIDLDVSDDVEVENVHLLDSLMKLSCNKSLQSGI